MFYLVPQATIYSLSTIPSLLHLPAVEEIGLFYIIYGLNLYCTTVNKQMDVTYVMDNDVCEVHMKKMVSYFIWTEV